jgi:hypothetical protein
MQAVLEDFEFFGEGVLLEIASVPSRDIFGSRRRDLVLVHNLNLFLLVALSAMTINSKLGTDQLVTAGKTLKYFCR